MPMCMRCLLRNGKSSDYISFRLVFDLYFNLLNCTLPYYILLYCAELYCLFMCCMHNLILCKMNYGIIMAYIMYGI